MSLLLFISYGRPQVHCHQRLSGPIHQFGNMRKGVYVSRNLLCCDCCDWNRGFANDSDIPWFEITVFYILCYVWLQFFDHWTVVDMNQERWMLYKINSVCTVYPKKYAHGFVVLCFVVIIQSFIMNPHEVFIHIHQGCFAGTGAIVRLPQCQWSKPDGYGKISQCITTTKHSKAKIVCIFLWIYCIWINIVVMKTERFMHIFLWKYLHFVLIHASMLVSIIISLLWFWEQLGLWMGTLHFWFNLTIDAHCICFHLLSKSVSMVLLAWMLDEQICSSNGLNLLRIRFSFKN